MFLAPRLLSRATHFSSATRRSASLPERGLLHRDRRMDQGLVRANTKNTIVQINRSHGLLSMIENIDSRHVQLPFLGLVDRDNRPVLAGNGASHEQ